MVSQSPRPTRSILKYLALRIPPIRRVYGRLGDVGDKIERIEILVEDQRNALSTRMNNLEAGRDITSDVDRQSIVDLAMTEHQGRRHETAARSCLPYFPRITERSNL